MAATNTHSRPSSTQARESGRVAQLAAPVSPHAEAQRGVQSQAGYPMPTTAPNRVLTMAVDVEGLVWVVGGCASASAYVTKSLSISVQNLELAVHRKEVFACGSARGKSECKLLLPVK